MLGIPAESTRSSDRSSTSRHETPRIASAFSLEYHPHDHRRTFRDEHLISQFVGPVRQAAQTAPPALETDQLRLIELSRAGVGVPQAMRQQE